MNIIIVEDEQIASDRLKTLLLQYDPEIRIQACLESVEESVQYLRQHPHPDLLLLDIHLSDGHSFSIFKKINYNGPVIFTTAYDSYALEAFKLLSIDYILKPVTQYALASAMNKLRGLRSNFNAASLTTSLATIPPSGYKKRFVGKIGQRLFFIETGQVAFFQAENKIVYLVDKEGARYVMEHTLEKLESMLDPKLFFRLNRRFIVHIQAIQQIKPWYNSRLRLTVQGAGREDELVISRERVSEFRCWAEG